MLDTANRKLWSGIAMIGSLALLGSLACDLAESVSVHEVKMQNCLVQYDPDFPTNGNFRMTMPANCPIKLSGTTTLSYAASAKFPSNEVQYGWYQLNVLNMQGQSWGGSGVQSAWSVDGQYYVFNAEGTYPAATGGFTAADTGFDVADNQFYTTQHGWKDAAGYLNYHLGSPSFYVSGPPNGAAYGSYELSGYTDDPTFNGPPSYEWWVDGTLVSTDQNLDWQAGPEGSQQSVAGKIFDIDGRSHTGYFTFTACTDNRIQC